MQIPGGTRPRGETSRLSFPAYSGGLRGGSGLWALGLSGCGLRVLAVWAVLIDWEGGREGQKKEGLKEGKEREREGGGRFFSKTPSRQRERLLRVHAPCASVAGPGPFFFFSCRRPMWHDPDSSAHCAFRPIGVWGKQEGGGRGGKRGKLSVVPSVLSVLARTCRAHLSTPWVGAFV